MLDNGYYLDGRFGRGGHFGGPSGIACPSCALPLLNLVTITDQLALGLCGWREWSLRVLFCRRCGASQAPLWYRQGGDTIEIVRYGTGEIEDDFPYPDYPEHVPEIEFGLVALPHQFASLQHELADDVDWPNDLVMFMETPRHQFLGKPFVYEEREHDCLSCGQRMRLVLTVANDIGEGYIQTDNSAVMLVVHACAECSMLVIEQQCD